MDKNRVVIVATQRVYQIVDWQKFEKSQARDCKKFKWVAVPISFRGAGYCNLMEQPDGATILGVWHVMMGLSADEDICPQRWVLATNKGPLTARRFNQVAYIDTELFERACEILSQPDIHWLHAIDWDFTSGLPPRYSPQEPVPERQLSLLEGEENPAPAATEEHCQQKPDSLPANPQTLPAEPPFTGSATASDTASLHVHGHAQLQTQLQPMSMTMSLARAKSETAHDGQPPPPPPDGPEVAIEEAKAKGYASLLALVPPDWPLAGDEAAYLRGAVNGVIHDAWPEGGCCEARVHVRKLGSLVIDGLRRAKEGQVEKPFAWAKARFNEWRQERRRDRPDAGQPRGGEAAALGDLVGLGVPAARSRVPP